MMNFGDFVHNNSCSDATPTNNDHIPAAADAAIAPPISADLSLSLQIGMERHEDEAHESRSESENLDDASGDDLEASNNPPAIQKSYHRHTPQQIQQLEAAFNECPHPDVNQRKELSRRLGLETRQVKFWFQNRRTQVKVQTERHKNSVLQQENDKLVAENMAMRVETARLKEQLDRAAAIAGTFLGRPLSAAELGVEGDADSPPVEADSVAPAETSIYSELALAAMEELVKMAEIDEPLWIKSLAIGKEILNIDEYVRNYASNCIGMKPDGLVTEATRETRTVFISSVELVEMMMDSNKWAEMFPCIIAKTTTTDVVSNGIGGTKNGALQLMHAELQVLSPLVPVREVKFLRFSKQYAEGVWVVVDVSIDDIQETFDGASAYPSCRRLPSGCLVQDMTNGYSLVTWVEHSEYDETVVHPLYRSLIISGLGFGSHRWLATLQRQCECLGTLMLSIMNHVDYNVMTPPGRANVLKLAQRMTNNFCSSVCASTVHKWNRLLPDVDNLTRIMVRESNNSFGEPSGIVVSVATSFWVPVTMQRLFDFLRNHRFRDRWDILSQSALIQEVARIGKGQDHGNSVSLIRVIGPNANQRNMLILQETCADTSGALVVYAPVDMQLLSEVMMGADSSGVQLLPSGFSIVPDGLNEVSLDSNGGAGRRVSGSLLTVTFQILGTGHPTAEITAETVEPVNNLMTSTVNKIKATLHEYRAYFRG